MVRTWRSPGRAASGRFDRLLLGSIARTVLTQFEGSVLIMREPVKG